MQGFLFGSFLLLSNQRSSLQDLLLISLLFHQKGGKPYSYFCYVTCFHLWFVFFLYFCLWELTHFKNQAHKHTELCLICLSKTYFEASGALTSVKQNNQAEIVLQAVREIPVPVTARKN